MDLSVIILSFNTKDITDECLSKLQSSVLSCQRRLKNNIEVIVLDNASTDGSVGMIEKKHSWVSLLVSKENTGFSKGNNLGLKKAKYPYILFLNSDCFVSDDTLISALDYFKNNSKVDVLGPNLTFSNGNFQPSAGDLPNPINVIFWILGLSFLSFHPRNRNFFKLSKEVGWVSGAFFMVKKEVLKKVGGFDETFFMYFEEVELCKRINDANFKIHYVPEIKVTHLHGASIGYGSTEPIIRELKGLKYYFKKYYPRVYLIVKMFLIFGLILRIIAFSLLGKTKRARAYMEGLSVI